MPGQYLLLDTNLLLLYLTSLVDLSLLTRFKRVSQFQRSDVALLQHLLDQYGGMMTTPHVLTEASNLIDQAPAFWKDLLVVALRDFAAEREEHYERSAVLMQRSEFADLALADTALVAFSRDVTIATLDYALYGRILGVKGMAVHFDHLRGKNYA